jgi:hypothetical protein
MNSTETIGPENEYVGEEGMGFGERVLSVFIAPREVCRNLLARPEWVRAFIVAAVIMGLAAVLVIRENAAFTREMMAQAGRIQLTEEQLARMSEVSTKSYVSRAVGGVFSAGVQMLLYSLVLLLCAKAMGGRERFRKIFSLVAYSSLIGSLGAVVMVAVVKLTGTFPVETSLGVLAGGSYWSLTRIALSSFEIFWIWQLVFLMIGMSVTEGFSTAKGVASAIILFVLRMGVLVGITAATRGFFGVA